MKRSIDRILCTHTGSLVRPKELRGGLGLKRPELADDYWTRLERGISDVVTKQSLIGIDVVNDGEYSKSGWSNYAVERIDGFTESKTERYPAYWLGRDAERFPDVINAEFPGIRNGVPAHCCTAELIYNDEEGLLRRLDLLRTSVSMTPASEAFFTAVAPGSAAFTGVNRYYYGDREYVFALAEALRTEYLAVYAAGFILQIDDSLLANMYDHLMQKGHEAYWRWAELRIEALNYALRGISPDRIRYHLCFGSWHSPHTSDAPLADLVDLILQVQAGAYMVEAANPRHEHEWRVWQNRKLPDGKVLIPGVVTHHTGIVEHPQVVADRLLRYAKLVGRENLIAGTDCGFAQSERLRRVDPDVMWAKLDSLVQGARIASRELWGAASSV